MVGAQVKLERVSKSYQPAAAARRCSMPLMPKSRDGEFVVLVGRSGSGKSTLLNLIGTIDTPTSGEIYIDDTALSALDETGRALLRRRRIGFVFQFFNLIPTLTAAENLQLPLELNGVTGAAEATRASPTASPRSDSPIAGIAFRRSFPAASSSVSRSPARWCMRRASCSPTSRPEISTWRPRPR